MTRRRSLDLFAAAAWPASEQHEEDGWLVRSTPGTRGRRLNSALPPEGAAGPPPAGVDLVLVTPLEEQGALDVALGEAGWRAEAATDVLTARSIAPGPRSDTIVERVDVVTWRRAWTALGTRERSGGMGADDVLDRIPFDVAPLVAVRDGVLAGIALAVLGDRVSLVVEVATAPAHRRRGVATALMRAWADAAGDRELVLQVMHDNAPGRALYDRLGFTRSHGYHYRRAPARTSA